MSAALLRDETERFSIFLIENNSGQSIVVDFLQNEPIFSEFIEWLASYDYRHDFLLEN